MVETIELHMEERILDRARRLAQTRHCKIEDVFEDAIERMTIIEAQTDPFLGMFKDEPDLVDWVTQSAMEARERHPLRTSENRQ